LEKERQIFSALFPKKITTDDVSVSGTVEGSALDTWSVLSAKKCSHCMERFFVYQHLISRANSSCRGRHAQKHTAADAEGNAAVRFRNLAMRCNSESRGIYYGRQPPLGRAAVSSLRRMLVLES